MLAIGDQQLAAEADFNPFDDQRNRRSFVRRVYAMLFAALAATAIQLLVVLLHDELLFWFVRHWWLTIVFLVGYTACYMTLVCCPAVRKQSPLNIVLFVTLVECMTGMTVYVTARYETYIVMAGFGLTCCVCLLITLVALVVPIDFTTKTMCLMVLGIVVTVVGVATLIVQLISPSYTLQVVYASLLVFTMSLYFAYDTQMVFGNKHFALDPDDTVYGATSLYVDVIVLFQNLLFLFGACMDDC